MIIAICKRYQSQGYTNHTCGRAYHTFLFSKKSNLEDEDWNRFSLTFEYLTLYKPKFDKLSDVKSACQLQHSYTNDHQGIVKIVLSVSDPLPKMLYSQIYVMTDSFHCIHKGDDEQEVFRF